MTFKDIVEHWGTQSKAMRALGIRSRQTMHNWRTKGVPRDAQCRIHLRTRGRLKADEKARG